jgi:type I restriction enzyme S subunit
MSKSAKIVGRVSTRQTTSTHGDVGLRDEAANPTYGGLGMAGELETLPLIGDLPPNWKVARFGDVLEGGTRNGIYKSKEFHGSGAKVVNMGELFAHPRLRDVPMKRVQLSDVELTKSCLNAGDLLFARRSLVAEGAGKCIVVSEVKETTTFESSIIRARPNPKTVDSLFLYYLFNSPYGTHE